MGFSYEQIPLSDKKFFLSLNLTSFDHVLNLDYYPGFAYWCADRERNAYLIHVGELRNFGEFYVFWMQGDRAAIIVRDHGTGNLKDGFEDVWLATELSTSSGNHCTNPDAFLDALRDAFKHMTRFPNTKSVQLVFSPELKHVTVPFADERPLKLLEKRRGEKSPVRQMLGWVDFLNSYRGRHNLLADEPMDLETAKAFVAETQAKGTAEFSFEISGGAKLVLYEGVGGYFEALSHCRAHPNQFYMARHTEGYKINWDPTCRQAMRNVFGDRELDLCFMEGKDLNRNQLPGTAKSISFRQ